MLLFTRVVIGNFWTKSGVSPIADQQLAVKSLFFFIKRFYYHRICWSVLIVMSLVLNNQWFSSHWHVLTNSRVKTFFDKAQEMLVRVPNSTAQEIWCLAENNHYLRWPRVATSSIWESLNLNIKTRTSEQIFSTKYDTVALSPMSQVESGKLVAMTQLDLIVRCLVTTLGCICPQDEMKAKKKLMRFVCLKFLKIIQWIAQLISSWEPKSIGNVPKSRVTQIFVSKLH